MLKKSSLQREKFKKEELTLFKKLDLNDISIAVPENLAQLLIWTSNLAQYDHALFIQKNQELALVAETDQEKRQELDEQIKFYKKRASVENQTKDFYLKKLLDQGDAVVKGYIQHPTKEEIKYAVIPYHGYDFVTLATSEIIAKFPVNFIEKEKESASQALADIHADEEELFSAVTDFIKPYRTKYKELVKKNKVIKEHNAAVQEIHKKIKNGEAELIKEVVVDVKQESPQPREKIAVPVENRIEPIESINSNEKPITVIKKRKFALVKEK